MVFRFGFRPMIVMQVTLLPEPDSPTIASVCPFSTLKETPSTAWTMPSSVRKYVFRSRTSSSGIVKILPGTGQSWYAGSGQSDPRVDPRIQQVDQQVEGDHHDRCEDHDPDDDRQVEGEH